MYIHLGEETTVRGSEVIGIFDIENTSISKHTKEFLASAEKNHAVEYVNFEMPKSFVVCESGGEDKVYISPISAATLRKRIRNVKSEK
ncbi:MAG: DUF370 domain-containing protein [Oscillospiraceae bacterium]|nr:DUF370 domain-containing protein [Oscillospiraceae bacterium]